MAARAAVLIALAALVAGCVKAPEKASAQGCGACHAAHYVDAGQCQQCHRGNPAAARASLAHERLVTGRAAASRLPEASAVLEGRRLVERLACRRCHRIDGKGNGFATDLDRVVWKREQSALVTSISEPAENMPRFSLDEAQAQALIAYLLHVGDERQPQDAYRVRFEGRAGSSMFEKHCGSCHRAITATGPLGTGSAGPNLTGLFTPFYPATAPAAATSPDARPWTAPLLEDWLVNPRRARSATTMPPVSLTRDERRALLQELGAAPAAARPR